MVDNSPAFPLHPGVSPDAAWARQQGMTLRDWFAGQVLAGIYANPKVGAMLPGRRVTCAYEAADDMLAARKEPGA